MIKKVLIANRGEIALRVIRTCQEMGIKTVAVYSTADRDSLPVRFADEAVCIGPPMGKDSYLKVDRIIAAAEVTGADAIHPGYGFLSENAEFSRICTDHGIKFIGPSPHCIEMMGNKSRAKETMIAAGVPVVPGSEGIVKTEADAMRIAKGMGFPVMIKASAGGGGRGMRPVFEESELIKAYNTASQEALGAFGNGEVYIEKLVQNPRHVEIQVMGDGRGKVVALGERDCSIQRRNQKLVEETPSPAVSPELREAMCEAGIKAAAALNYEGAGTIEFLLDKTGAFYFMEMNTRIQVEHTVTEEVTDIDLIELQIRMANGEELDLPRIVPMSGHSIQCRINAEDPYHDFRPSAGKITDFHTPKGHGVRVDTHAFAHYQIPPYYDSMIAKLIVKAHTREAAIAKMRRALNEFIVSGVKTTIPFHQQLMQDERFLSGNFDTGFMQDFKLK